jgi:hypothetical protein
MTPRYRKEHGIKIGERDIFYYIDKLYDNNPLSVIDVGCGECIFKNWFPNIIGFDPRQWHNSRADFVDFFDEDFSKNHTSKWSCGMALNSIHFIPWNQLSKQIDLAMNIIQPGGRFLFTINFNMLDIHSEDKSVVNLSSIEKINHIHQIISNSSYKIIVSDYPLLHNLSEDLVDRYAHITGHSRFVLEK